MSKKFFVAAIFDLARNHQQQNNSAKNHNFFDDLNARLISANTIQFTPILIITIRMRSKLLLQPSVLEPIYPPQQSGYVTLGLSQYSPHQLSCQITYSPHHGNYTIMGAKISWWSIMGTTRNFYATPRLHANVLHSNTLHHNT